MKFSISLLLVALAVRASAKPAGPVLGYQDSLGQYSFGYSNPLQARSETRSLDGVTRGSYSYVDGAGVIQSAEYTADGQNGFRVVATNLPQAPVPGQGNLGVSSSTTLSVVAEGEHGVQSTKNPAVRSAPVTLKIADDQPIEEAEGKEAEAEPTEPKSVEPIVEPAVESRTAEEEPQEAGRAVEEQEPAVAPVIASAAATLPVPLIPVNFDPPSISAYTGRPAGAKAEQTLPQSTPAQGITPAGTTLKSLPAPQLVRVAPQVSLVSEPVAQSAPGAVSSRAIQWTHYPIARAGFAPTAPVNIIPFGYDPSISSFYRYAPFPYVAYNVL